MVRHSIDHALLAAEAGSREEPAGRRLPVDNPYESPKAVLLSEVAQAGVPAGRTGMGLAVTLARPTAKLSITFAG